MRSVDVGDIPLDVLLAEPEVIIEGVGEHGAHGDVIAIGRYVIVRRSVDTGPGLVPIRAWVFSSEEERELTLANVTEQFG